jgi:hypothetical protein
MGGTAGCRNCLGNQFGNRKKNRWTGRCCERRPARDPKPAKGFKAMARLSYVILLVLLVSNVYAAETASGPANENFVAAAALDANGGIANGAILGRVLSSDALPADASANGASGIRRIEPFTAKRNERPDRLYRASQLAFLGSIVADLGTTWSLPNGRVEGNPLLGKSKVQQVSVSSALALFTLWEAHALHVRGNRGAARYLLWMGSIAHALAGSYNAR